MKKYKNEIFVRSYLLLGVEDRIAAFRSTYKRTIEITEPQAPLDLFTLLRSRGNGKEDHNAVLATARMRQRY